MIRSESMGVLGELVLDLAMPLGNRPFVLIFSGEAKMLAEHRQSIY